MQGKKHSASERQHSSLITGRCFLLDDFSESEIDLNLKSI